MAYLKITSLGSSDLRVEGKVDVLVMSLALMRRSVDMTEMQIIKDTADSSRKQGTPSKKNQILFLIKKCYLVLALSFRFFGNLAY